MTTIAPMTERVSSRSAPTRLDTVDVRWMIGLGAVALIVRLWFVLSVGQTTFAFNDAAVYNTIAVSLAHGHGFRGIYGQLTAQWPPGYPFVLSLAYRIFGAHPTTGEVLNAVLGAGTVPILYFAARRTLGRVEAIFVGAGMTLLLGQVFWADVLISEALYAFVLAILLALLAVLPSARPRSAVLVGLALGAATLTRGEGFLLLAVPLAMWWPQLSRRGPPQAGGHPLRGDPRLRRALDDPQRGGDARVRPAQHEFFLDVLVGSQPERRWRAQLPLPGAAIPGHGAGHESPT